MHWVQARKAMEDRDAWSVRKRVHMGEEEVRHGYRRCRPQLPGDRSRLLQQERYQVQCLPSVALQQVPCSRLTCPKDGVQKGGLAVAVLFFIHSTISFFLSAPLCHFMQYPKNTLSDVILKSTLFAILNIVIIHD